MYDRHKPIIKWYEYDASKLYKTAESEDPAGEAKAEEAAPADDNGSLTDAVEAAGGEDAPLTGSELDDEVARIMAAFSGAKQNDVDDVFAMMAAQAQEDGTAEPAGSSAASDEEELLASILAPRQNGVDDLVAKAREG